MRLVPIRMAIALALCAGLALGVAGMRVYGQSGKSSPATAGALPPDVYPDSLSRLPLVKRDSLDDAGKKAYDEAAGDTRSLVGLQGPGGLRLHSPRMAETARPLNQYLRYDTKLGRPLSELAILVTAREMNQQFEWTAHEITGLKAGLKQETIDAVKYRKPVAGLDEKEAAIIQLGREVFQKHTVSSATFAKALQLFGDEELVDMVSLMGYYASTSVLLNTVDQHLLPTEKPLLPMP